MKGKTAKIVGIGANVFDTLISVPCFPAEDTKIRGESIIHCGGGPCATGLCAASKLGADCAYIGNFAKDSAGVFLKEDLERYGVSAEYTKDFTDCKSFSSYILINKQNASRTCVFHKGSVPATELGDGELRTIEEARILMLDGNELEAAVLAAKTARKNGVHVLCDAGSIYDGIERLLPYCDILIPSEEFALESTGAENTDAAARELMRRYSPEVVVITRGKDGGVMLDDGGLRHYPSFKVKAVDTNGAGDVFHGAFAFGMIKGFEYFKCCVFASAVSAIKCMGAGARKSVPDYETAKKFLKERGYDGF